MTTTVITTEQAIEAADDYRKAQARIEKINYQINERVAEIKAKHAMELDNMEAIKTMSAGKLETYLKDNEDELLNGKRSIEFAGLKMGFRKAAAKVSLVGKTTWEKVIKLLQADEGTKHLVNLKPEVNKNELKKLEAAQLKKLGVQVEQEDNFYVSL